MKNLMLPTGRIFWYLRSWVHFSVLYPWYSYRTEYLGFSLWLLLPVLYVEAAPYVSAVACACLYSGKRGGKKRDFTKEAFLSLTWPHLDQENFLDPNLAPLGLHLEISRDFTLVARDFTKKTFLSLTWPHRGPHLGISRLEISPRKLPWPYLGHIVGYILKSPS